jgi:hypothetical protein
MERSTGLARTSELLAHKIPAAMTATPMRTAELIRQRRLSDRARIDGCSCKVIHGRRILTLRNDLLWRFLDYLAFLAANEVNLGPAAPKSPEVSNLIQVDDENPRLAALILHDGEGPPWRRGFGATFNICGQFHPIRSFRASADCKVSSTRASEDVPTLAPLRGRDRAPGEACTMGVRCRWRLEERGGLPNELKIARAAMEIRVTHHSERRSGPEGSTLRICDEPDTSRAAASTATSRSPAAGP